MIDDSREGRQADVAVAMNTGTQAVQGFGLKPGWGSCALPLFAAGWVDNAPRPIANGWLALDLAPLSGGIWQIE